MALITLITLSPKPNPKQSVDEFLVSETLPTGGEALQAAAAASKGVRTHGLGPRVPIHATSTFEGPYIG